jgi:hypothetical protein|tara:strand:+ start:2557 stop:2775 length:219 start_codon:yes stop_codon:yes gene_type:complete
VKVGDLIFWCPNGTIPSSNPELGIIIDKQEHRIKVFEMGDYSDGADWWEEGDWKILKEKPLTAHDHPVILGE